MQLLIFAINYRAKIIPNNRTESRDIKLYLNYKHLNTIVFKIQTFRYKFHVYRNVSIFDLLLLIFFLKPHLILWAGPMESTLNIFLTFLDGNVRNNVGLHFIANLENVICKKWKSFFV